MTRTRLGTPGDGSYGPGHWLPLLEDDVVQLPDLGVTVVCVPGVTVYGVV